MKSACVYIPGPYKISHALLPVIHCETKDQYIGIINDMKGRVTSISMIIIIPFM
jgi:hypothetical protein